VAKFLEHVLVVADSIIDDLCNHKFVCTAPLKSIAEHDGSNDDGHDEDDGDGHDEDEDDVNDGDERVAVGANLEEKTRCTRRGFSSGHKHNVLAMRVSNAYSATGTGKENAYMPLTAANISTRPTTFIKKF